MTESSPVFVHAQSDFPAVAECLLSGKHALLEDIYPTGLNVLSALRKLVFATKGKQLKPTSGDFHAYRRSRSVYREASNRLLVPVERNRIALRKAPAIGWLNDLYPDITDFLLPFPQIQGLNSSWQWYRKGILYPVLNYRIFPFYGTYFPTRFDHLILFDTWLRKYSGRKNNALDIGTGCGVLSFQLLKHGFRHVTATDINPNAIISVLENAHTQGVGNRLTAHVGDLFNPCPHKADLIVFNPPWLPSDDETNILDKAVYYQSGLFDRFFEQASGYLEDGGRMVLFFSNLGASEGIEAVHPIEEELKANTGYKKIRTVRRKAAGPSQKTRRRDHRKEEYVELWELAKA